MKLLLVLLFIPILLLSAPKKDADPVKVSPAIGNSIHALCSGNSVLFICASGWVIEPIDSDRKVNIKCAPLVRDSLGNLIRLPFRTRLFGVDTSRIKFRETVLDTVPSDWGKSEVKLIDGKFKVKKEM